MARPVAIAYGMSGDVVGLPNLERCYVPVAVCSRVDRDYLDQRVETLQ